MPPLKTFRFQYRHNSRIIISIDAYSEKEALILLDGIIATNTVVDYDLIS